MLTGQLVLGSVMIAVISAIHVTILIGLIYYLQAVIPSISQIKKFVCATRIFLTTIIGIVVSHTIEVWLWAIAYRVIGEFETLERALYFSTVTFTTLGYGDVVLSNRWQLLSSFEAVSGIILFGISTAFAFAVMRRIFELFELVKTE